MDSLPFSPLFYLNYLFIMHKHILLYYISMI